jgi:hypothetical protein
LDERAWKFMKVWPMIVKEAACPPAKNPHFKVLGMRDVRVVLISR